MTAPGVYRSKSEPVEAMRVPAWGDETNAVEFVDLVIEIAEWCGGVSHMMDPPADIAEGIHLADGNVARAGEWIVKLSPQLFGVVEPDVFERLYVSIDPRHATPKYQMSCEHFNQLPNSSRLAVIAAGFPLVDGETNLPSWFGFPPLTTVELELGR